MEDTKKNLRPLGHLKGLPLAPSKWLWPPYKWKKIVWIIGLTVFKSTGTDSRFQRKKNIHRVPRYYKKIETKIQVREVCLKWPTKNFWPLYKWKKIVWIIGFTVFKSTDSDSRSQRKNRVWKICIESQDISKKVPKIVLPNQTSKIWHIFANISGLGAYI